VVFAADAGKSPNRSRLEGATVQVTCVMRSYRGKPEIVLKTASHLRVASRVDGDTPQACRLRPLVWLRRGFHLLFVLARG